MHPHSAARTLGNVLAIVLIVAGVIYALESLGLNTGVPQLMVCRVGQNLLLNFAPGLVQVLLIFGVLLLIVPWTRPWGVTLLVAGGIGLVLVEGWAQYALPYCIGSTPNGGFTP